MSVNRRNAWPWALIAAALMAFGCSPQAAREGGPAFTVPNSRVEFTFPIGWFQNRKENPFDLQCFSKKEDMTTGVFLYHRADLADGLDPKELLDLQVEDMRSKRGNFALLERVQTESLGDKRLTSVVYSGEKGVSRYYYRFTLVEFDQEQDVLLVTLQTAIPNGWGRSKTVLEEITRTARVNEGRAGSRIK